MRVDIWSDVMCPFCYIGKRKLESALEQFEHKDKVELNWHSFQLDPDMKYEPGKDIHTYLAERKGQTKEWSVKMHEQMTQRAKEDGLTYNFDKAIIANSFDAHRLVQLAKKYGLGNDAEEKLFKAYFTDGKNISDHNTLMHIGIELGLKVVEIGEMLNSDKYADEVRNDITTAQQLGINGVPFFVINGKYGISGAQPSSVFLGGLQQAWREHERDLLLHDIDIKEGDVCTPGGDC